MAGPPTLHPNLGAEEGGNALRHLRRPPVRAAAALWAGLFGADALRSCGELVACSAAALGDDAERPALAQLERADGLVPWLAWSDLPERPPLWSALAPFEVVRAVHDKAFALRVAPAAARVAGLGDDPASAGARVVEPADIEADPECVAAELLEHFAAPAFAGMRIAVKPRFGTTGRGRFAFEAGSRDREGLGRALARMAARGGALAEPWLERLEDLSAQLWIAPDGQAELLATLRACVTPSGVGSGHRGRVAPDGRVDSGSAHDAGLRAAALEVARRAAAAGYRGPCGVDAFVYRSADGREALRPCVELNARFTTGTCSAGWLRRACRGAGAARKPAFWVGVSRPRGRDDAIDLGQGAWWLWDDALPPACPA